MGVGLVLRPSGQVGLHAWEATWVARNFRGEGVHEPARIAALAGPGEILASQVTAAGTRYQVSEPRTETLKGIAEPAGIVSVDWR